MLHIGGQVVVSKIIGHAEAAAKHGLVVAEDSRSPSKTHHRTKIVVLVRKFWHRGQALRQRGIPERTGSGLLGHTLVVQQVTGLLVKIPSQSEIQGEVIFAPPVILKVQPQIVFLEAQARLPIRDRRGGRDRRVGDEGVEIRVSESCIAVEQAIIRGTLLIVLTSPFHHVPAANHGGIVLQLIDVDDAALGKFNVLAQSESRGVLNRDLRRTGAEGR